MKRNNEALWNGRWGGKCHIIQTNANLNVLALRREINHNRVIAIFNFSSQKQNLTIKASSFTGQYYDPLAREIIILKEKINFNLEEWGYKILSSPIMESPWLE